MLKGGRLAAGEIKVAGFESAVPVVSWELVF